MKKRKIKLFASIASFAMVAAVAVTGILAATSATLAVNSKVSFSATGFTGALTASVKNDTNALDEYSATIKADGVYEGANLVATPTWNIDVDDVTPEAQAVGFIGDGTKDIVYTFNLTEIKTTLDIGASVTFADEWTDANEDNTFEAANKNYTVTLAIADEVSGATTNGTIGVTITLKLIDVGSSFNAEAFNFSIAFAPIS